MRIVDSWSGGASALRRHHYRVVEEDGRYRLELQVGEAWTVLETGHLVAQRIAELLIEEDRKRNVSELRRKSG